MNAGEHIILCECLPKTFMPFNYEAPEWRWLMQGQAPTPVGLLFVYFSLDLFTKYIVPLSLFFPTNSSFSDLRSLRRSFCDYLTHEMLITNMILVASGMPYGPG